MTENQRKVDNKYIYQAMEALQDLNYGLEVRQDESTKVIDRQRLVKSVIQRMKEHNYFEQLRCGVIPLEREDYLEFGNRNKQ